ncbi:hypothetical protein [Flavobacterium sp.]|uniref:hypothetical protein n=1 Tax=Flavobacterium sp. TaxID=239 RepID=UPI00248A4804|nr:hypothetical protein [Flavobacterium sp.]MDI1318033.1 hypothetical protein [Flavobacterium sp.]
MNMKEFKLENEPKITSGFTSPDGYFDLLSEQVLARITSDKEVKVMSLLKSRKRSYYAIAAVVIMLLSIPIYTRLATNTTSIESAALDNYLAYHSISEDLILDLLDQDDIDKLAIEITLDDATLEDALKSNSNLEEYIIN